ncbi:MAG: hypothetical protein LBP99_03075 [Azoarcus sp.]|jgi:hypothetical protein|nr:hypothetical protein [Azoarcus sp.]
METIITPEVPSMRPEEIAALERLIAIACANDPGGSMSQGSTHQSMIVADFLLSWWDSVNCGHFDITNLWAIDAVIVADMQIVFGMIARVRVYPDVLGYEEQFKAVMENWRTNREVEQE